MGLPANEVGKRVKEDVRKKILIFSVIKEIGLTGDLQL